MKAIRKSIKVKILIVVLTAVFVTTALISAVSLMRQVKQFEEETTKQTRATAFIFSATVADHLANRNKFAALRSLRAIKRVPHFTKILVTDNKNRSFAELGSAVILKRKQDDRSLFRRNMAITVPVIKGGVRIGNLTVIIKTDHLYKLLLNDIALTFIAALFAALAGIVLSLKMQAKITAPIKSLTDKMMEIKLTQNFNHRLPTQSEDETGQLVEAFNDMQHNIRLRDQKLADHLERLEQTVEERTRELVIAKDAAEQASAAKSDFLATMSHEIRTPMNGMLVMAELLSSARLTDQNRRYANVIAKSGQSLLTIINDILDFSKIEAGKLELESLELDPSATLDDVMGLFWGRAASKDLELAAYVAPDVPLGIKGDPVRLSQVLTNLVNNALKFTLEGSVSLEILVRSIDPESQRATLEFAVTDTGIGIPQDKCASIFDAFSQADQSTTRNFGGTGLGLAICQRLVGAMGGEIFVTSKPGEGSRFAFTLDTKIAKPATNSALLLPARLKTAVVAASSPAFDQVIGRYLDDFDIAARFISPAIITLKDIEESSLFIADTAIIEQVYASVGGERVGRSPYVVCLASIGDNSFQESLKRGLVDEVLAKPVSRHDVSELLFRLDGDKPRGASLLEQKSTAQNSFVQFPGAHILVADDSPVNREVVLAALMRLDITCETVENGREALEAVEKKDYDAILMDCSMPEMDGFTATKKIRELEHASHRKRHPIIALTAHVAGLADHEWQSVGMDDYLTKPFRLQELADSLAVYLPHQEEKPGQPAGDEAVELSEKDTISHPQNFEETVSDDPSHAPVIDDAVMDSYGEFQEDGGAELIARLLTLFLEHAPSALLDVEMMAKGRDCDALAAAAHALKSMSRNIGAVRLSEACNRLELAARAQQELDLEDYIPSIKDELERVNVRIAEIAIERQLLIGADTSSAECA